MCRLSWIVGRDMDSVSFTSGLVRVDVDVDVEVDVVRQGGDRYDGQSIHPHMEIIYYSTYSTPYLGMYYRCKLGL